jgi:hypothetical protein
MKVAYLVLAHRDPELVRRLVRALSCRDCAFFIHVDRNSDLQKFADIGGRSVFFTDKRVPVYWGGFSIVDATLLLLRQAFNHEESWDYFVLLSGSHYPLRSSAYIHSFLENNCRSEFISMVRIPNSTYGMPLSKLNRVWFEPDKPVHRFVTRAIAKVGLAQRDHRSHLGELEPYGGSQWWALTRKACQHILERVASEVRLARFFRNACTPDEMFFHTILGNSPFRVFARRGLTYADWSAGPRHPAAITERHLALFEDPEWVWGDDIWGSGEALFARKFSVGSLALLDRIDAMTGLSDDVTRHR